MQSACGLGWFFPALCPLSTPIGGGHLLTLDPCAFPVRPGWESLRQPHTFLCLGILAVPPSPAQLPGAHGSLAAGRGEVAQTQLGR